MQSISLEPWIEQQMSLPSMLMRDQAYLTIFFALGYRNGSIFHRPVTRDDAMQKTLSFLPFKQLFTSKKSSFNVSRFQFLRNYQFVRNYQFPCFWIILMALRHKEMFCWVTSNDNASSSYVWHGSPSNNASNSTSSNFTLKPCKPLLTRSLR